MGMTNTPKHTGKGLFITGTDTGAGKTVVVAALIGVLKSHGLNVGVMKPAESGCHLSEIGELFPEDALFLRSISANKDPIHIVNPYAFVQPLTPALAAEMSGVRIQMEKIIAAYDILAKSHDLVLVEGAGGLLAPLTEKECMLDIACTLKLPVLVVAKNVLGVINHADLTVRVAQAAGVEVVGIILNNPDLDVNPAIYTNATSIQRWVAASYLGEMPHLSGIDYVTITQAAKKHLKLNDLFKLLIN